jgi:hypothetical protein
MYHDMYGSWGTGWDWLWMTFLMLLWLAVIGGVVYASVRIALSHQRDDRSEHRHELRNSS